MPTVDCETSEEYFYDSKRSLASEASEDSFHSANEEFFLPYDVRTDVRRFQLITNLQTNCTVQSCFSRHAGGSSKYALNKRSYILSAVVYIYIVKH